MNIKKSEIIYNNKYISIKKILLILILLVIIFIYIYTKNLKNIDHIALIEINGMISEKEDSNSINIIEALDKAFNNKKAKGIIIKINSPGGKPVQANIIHNYIKRIKKSNKKEIISIIEDIGTSGAYLIATATNKIYCDPSSIVGSIGVILNSFGFVETINKLGIERRLYKSGKHKGIMDPFTKTNNEENIIIQKTMNHIHEEFINIVKRNRKNKIIKEEEIFTGRFWTGKEALNLGLVDGFFDIYSLSIDIFKTKNIIKYNKDHDIIKKIMTK